VRLWQPQVVELWQENDSAQVFCPLEEVQQSSRLASFVAANALLVIPPRDRPYDAGEMVDALLQSPPIPTPS
jgi:molybdopterin biosynthesis enzyme